MKSAPIGVRLRWGKFGVGHERDAQQGGVRDALDPERAITFKTKTPGN